MRCVELRAGHGHALFVFPGAGGEADELTPLAEALETRRPVVGVEPFESDEGASVEEAAEAAVALIRTWQPEGPYHLLGYSFGGLLAIEVARSLRAAGDSVPFVGLVDVIYDRRYWPYRIFAAATARRTAHHLRRLVREPPGRALPELLARSRRLAGHVASRADTARAQALATSRDRQTANTEAMARWRPRPVAGSVVLFTGGKGGDFACDPADLWRAWIGDLETRRVPGSHLGIVRDPDSLRALAEAVERELAKTEVPALRVLLATAFPWESACRLAMELARVGCVVEAAAPPNSAIHGLEAVAGSYQLERVRPVRSLRRALAESRADVVIPFDDRTRRALHLIHDRADPSTPSGLRLRERIEKSLGPPDTYSWIYSRAAVMALAAECGVTCPPTTPAANVGEVIDWMGRHGGVVVLKTDGSWGGRGIAVVRDAQTAARAWRRLSRPPGWPRVAKRFVVERDPWPLRSRLAGRRPVVSVQAYVDGTPANAAVACVDGELVGAVQAEVICSDGEFGPSTVIRIIDDAEILTAVETMVRRLRLSGLCGFDFVLEAGTRRPHLIEVNPRATPTPHLLTAGGLDLLTSWRDALGHAGPPARSRTYPDGLVALFPQEMRRDPNSPFLASAYHDVPEEDSELAARVMRSVRGRPWFGTRWSKGF